MTMKKHHLLLILSLGAVIGLVSWASVRAQANSGAQATVIAVLEVGRVFNTCKEKTDIDANARSAQEKADVDKAEREESIKQLQFDMELINPDSPQSKKKRQEIERKVVEYQVEIQYRRQQIVREQMRRYELLYKKLRDTCSEVAQANGFDLVLFKETEKLNYKAPQDLVNQIGGRKVLWAAERLNITDQVIQKLNNVWDAGDN